MRGILDRQGVYKSSRAATEPLLLSPFDTAVRAAASLPAAAGAAGCNRSAAAGAILGISHNFSDAAVQPMYGGCVPDDPAAFSGSFGREGCGRSGTAGGLPGISENSSNVAAQPMVNLELASAASLAADSGCDPFAAAGAPLNIGYSLSDAAAQPMFDLEPAGAAVSATGGSRSRSAEAGVPPPNFSHNHMEAAAQPVFRRGAFAAASGCSVSAGSGSCNPSAAAGVLLGIGHSFSDAAAQPMFGGYAAAEPAGRASRDVSSGDSQTWAVMRGACMYITQAWSGHSECYQSLGNQGLTVAESGASSGC